MQKSDYYWFADNKPSDKCKTAVKLILYFVIICLQNSSLSLVQNACVKYESLFFKQCARHVGQI